jgi:nitroreductase
MDGETVGSDARAQVAEFLLRTRNTRSFRAKPVPGESLAGILEIARWTGSAGNLQPWQIVVVDYPEIIRALAATGPNLPWLAGAPLVMVLAVDREAPDGGSFDEGRLAERILLAARAYGLSAGLGWFLPGDARKIAREITGVPDRYAVRTAIAIGEPASASESAAPSATPFPRSQARKPLAEVVHRNRFGTPPD